MGIILRALTHLGLLYLLCEKHGHRNRMRRVFFNLWLWPTQWDIHVHSIIILKSSCVLKLAYETSCLTDCGKTYLSILTSSCAPGREETGNGPL